MLHPEISLEILAKYNVIISVVYPDPPVPAYLSDVLIRNAIVMYS